MAEFPRDEGRLRFMPRADGRPPRRLHRGTYLLPSLFTLVNMFCGYACVVYAMRGEYETAAPFIGFAIVLDMLDGRIARLTGTTSDFGVQFDSLADVISFGMAPALLAYLWALDTLPKPWSLAPFLYLAAGAARLARFNIQVAVQDRRYFVGLPIPAAACAIVATVFYSPVPVTDPVAGGLVAVFVTVLAILMVGKGRYRSFKDIDLRSRTRWVVVTGMALAYFVVAASPQIVGVVLSFGYLVSGLVPRTW